ncbi:MAG: L,D-transpeptidase family protein [Solirubrobacteraceae bacterium]
MQPIWRPRLLALACVLALGVCASRAAGARAAASFAVPARARQLIVVSSQGYDPRGRIATLTAYERSGPGSPWRPAMPAMPAEIGYSGLRDERREGDGSTPTGVYSIGARIFGNEPDPGRLHYAYVRLKCGAWWDENPYSTLYNRFVQTRCGTTPAFANGSEALWRETTAYPYFAVIDFNTSPVIAGAAAPGSGIFLHSWVSGPTAGCVAVHEQRLLALLRWLTPRADPRIAIGTSGQLRSLP